MGIRGGRSPGRKINIVKESFILAAVTRDPDLRLEITLCFGDGFIRERLRLNEKWVIIRVTREAD